MKNEELSKRVKELRNRKGISQEVLAEKSGLSLRTVQRIENGETEPRGDSLKRLANVFNVSPDEIMDWKVVEDKNMLVLLNITQFSFLAFPLLGIIIPLAVWILKKDKVKGVDETGRAILNFQMTWVLLSFILSISLGASMMFDLRLPFSFKSLILIFGILYGYNLIMIIFNTIRSLRRSKVYYVPALNILRK